MITKERIRTQGPSKADLETQLACGHMHLRVQEVTVAKSTGQVVFAALSQSHWDCRFSNWFEDDGLGLGVNIIVFSNVSESMFD